MLNISDTLKTIYKTNMLADGTMANINHVLYFPSLSLTVDNDNLDLNNPPRLKESICSDAQIRFGACEAATLDVTIADITADIIGQEFTYAQIVNGTYTLNLGTFTVRSYVKQKNTRFATITAYDCMVKSDIDVSAWYNGLFPLGNETYTKKQFRTSLLSYLGIAEELVSLPNDNMVISKTISPTKLIGREVLTAIEQLDGTFGHIDRDGNYHPVYLYPYQQNGLYPSSTLYPSETLYPISATDSSFSVPADETITVAMNRGVDFESYIVNEITKLQIRQESGDVGVIVGTGTNMYIIEGNFLCFGKSSVELTVIANNALSMMIKRLYTPCTGTITGLPYIECGDALKFDIDTDITTYVLSRTLVGTQSLIDEIETNGTLNQEVSTSLSSEIIQLQGKTAVIVKTVDELSGTLSDLATDTSSSITILSDNIALKVDKAGVIAAINISPETVSIDANNINLNGVVTANENFKILTDGSMKAVNGNFSGAIESNSATITGGNLRLVGTASYSWMGEPETTHRGQVYIEGGRIKITDYDSGVDGEALFVSNEGIATDSSGQGTGVIAFRSQLYEYIGTDSLPHYSYALVSQTDGSPNVMRALRGRILLHPGVLQSICKEDDTRTNKFSLTLNDQYGYDVEGNIDYTNILTSDDAGDGFLSFGQSMGSASNSVLYEGLQFSNDPSNKYIKAVDGDGNLVSVLASNTWGAVSALECTKDVNERVTSIELTFTDTSTLTIPVTYDTNDNITAIADTVITYV